MDKQSEIKITNEMQETLAQMKADDIEEYGEMAYEEFQCEACGEFKIRAGSIMYEEYRLCNDCALIAELCFALGKIKNIKEIINQMEDKRFDAVYNTIFNSEEK